MKKIVSLLLAFGILAGFFTFTAFAQDTEAPEVSLLTVSDFNPQSEAARQDIISEADNLPEKFDLRDFNGKNYVTPVKRQLPFNSCWTFGITGAAEISFLHDNGFGVPAGTENDLIDFSEKYISWFARHAITEEEVKRGHIRASQIGEGYDLTESEADYINTAYDTGGDASYGINFFSGGFGPYIERLEVNGRQPYAYRGNNGWRNNDTNEPEDRAPLRKEYYKKMQMFSKMYDLIDEGVINSEAEFDEWFDSEWSEGHSLYEDSFSGSEYAGFDDWSIPLTAEYLVPDEVVHFKNSYALLSPKSSDEYEYDEAGIAAIKTELTRGHGVALGIRADISRAGQETDENGYINTTTWAQYYTDTPTANHVVTVVGYDDNYPKENFTRFANGEAIEGSTPPADGAFILKNSWGALTEEDKASATVNKYGAPVYESPNANPWGIDDTGYFYISYYDHGIYDAISFEFTPIIETKYLYVNYDQYDLLLATTYQSETSENELKAANVFDAEEDEYLFQVSAMITAPRTTVRYEIYKDVEDGNPCSGTLLEEGEVYREFAGYQRIDLKDEYFLEQGEKYAVIITQSYETENGTTYAAPYSLMGNVYPMQGIILKMKGVVNPGESLLYKDGEWADFADVKEEIIDARWAECGPEEFALMLFKNGRDDIVVDNFPIKAYLVPAAHHDEILASEAE